MQPYIPADSARRLEILAQHLAAWRNTKNLISNRSHVNIWSRHIHDSFQILNLAPNAKRWLDIGSGAGFPGLVIAIQLYGVSGAEVHCVESDKRKCAFMAQIVRDTGIPAVIHTARIEDIECGSLAPIDAVTARALTSFPKLLKLCQNYFDHGATGIFPLGRKEGERLKLEQLICSYTIEKVRSDTDPDSCIVRVSKTMV